MFVMETLYHIAANSFRKLCISSQLEQGLQNSQDLNQSFFPSLASLCLFSFLSQPSLSDRSYASLAFIWFQFHSREASEGFEHSKIFPHHIRSYLELLYYLELSHNHSHHLGFIIDPMRVTNHEMVVVFAVFTLQRKRSHSLDSERVKYKQS